MKRAENLKVIKMPLFSIKKNRLDPIAQTNFPNEKTLQSIVEGNLKTIFKCSLVASECSTGRSHGGRIDTLLLEDNNPVIIEYKKAESSELITQSLFIFHGYVITRVISKLRHKRNWDRKSKLTSLTSA